MFAIELGMWSGRWLCCHRALEQKVQQHSKGVQQQRHSTQQLQPADGRCSAACLPLLCYHMQHLQRQMVSGLT
jgi:hypothetical protein